VIIMGHKGSKSRTGGKKLVEAEDMLGMPRSGFSVHDGPHPQFVKSDGEWGITRSGELWQCQAGTWQAFRAPREPSGNVTPFQGTQRLSGTSRASSEPRGRWIAATPMPGIRNGDRKHR
jgi:hypothetical protein